MGKQNNIVENMFLEKLTLFLATLGYIDCKLLTLATRFSCRIRFLQ